MNAIYGRDAFGNQYEIPQRKQYEINWKRDEAKAKRAQSKRHRQWADDQIFAAEELERMAAKEDAIADTWQQQHDAYEVTK